MIDSWRTSQAGGLRNKHTRTEDGRVRVSALTDDCPAKASPANGPAVSRLLKVIRILLTSIVVSPLLYMSCEGLMVSY